MEAHAPLALRVPANESNMIRAEGLSKRYDRTVAVDNVSFEVEKGEIVGFLGPNGAGKTSTMRMLTCYMPPSEGTAQVAGFDITDQPEEVKKRIGYLPESPPVYPEMTVTEYLDFVARLKGLRGNQVSQRLTYALERCAVVEVKDKLIQRLSKGYRQRVGLAQAIIHDPDVLILDEPTSGFDPKQINETRDLIRSLAGDHTIILSTHILSEVEAMCQKVMIINRGKLVATDTVTNLAQRMRGGDAVQLRIAGPGGLHIEAGSARQRLEAIPGVSRVSTAQQGPQHVLDFEVEVMQGGSASGQQVRARVARSVVEAGWDLLELRGAAYSLEDVFLQLTSTESEPVIEGEEEASNPEQTS